MIDYYVDQFKRNQKVFENLLTALSVEEYTWREREGKWNIMEILCHLYDEEREDFRTRLKSVLENPANHFPQIDPAGWVSERKYMEQDFERMLDKFLEERDASVAWLISLEEPAWDSTYEHPKIGPMSARFIIANWLAHDYLHIRQLIRIKYHYLQFQSGQDLSYAGDW